LIKEQRRKQGVIIQEGPDKKIDVKHFEKKLHKGGKHTIAVSAIDSDDDTPDEDGNTKFEPGGVTFGLNKGKKDFMMSLR
jgi:hypothetical protein